MMAALGRISRWLGQQPMGNFLGPRALLLVVWFGTPAISESYSNLFWPLLGFLLVPITAMSYAFAIQTSGRIDGVWLLAILFALSFDAAHSWGRYGQVPLASMWAQFKKDVVAGRAILLGEARTKN